MDLPVMPPVAPMLAKAVPTIPSEPGLIYEPKWDGFRAIFFRDGDEVEITSRNERSLARYFPELLDAARVALPDRCVIDGEIVIVGATGLDFDTLSQRIHPAASRIELLARTTPAHFVAYDVLADAKTNLMGTNFVDRRTRLVELLGSGGAQAHLVHLTPATTEYSLAVDWFSRFEGAGLDGVMAKSMEGPYRPGERTMRKIKHVRDADCVIGGFRWYRDQPGMLGSLLLGLYDDNDVLHHVGVAGSFPAAKRRELAQLLAPLALDGSGDHPWQGDPRGPAGPVGSGPEASSASGVTNRRPGTPSRWSGGRDTSWVALPPTLVAEVSYGQLTAGRFRHNATFLRLRPDRDPISCRYSQLDVPVPLELDQLFVST